MHEQLAFLPTIAPVGPAAVDAVLRADLPVECRIRAVSTAEPTGATSLALPTSRAWAAPPPQLVVFDARDETWLPVLASVVRWLSPDRAPVWLLHLRRCREPADVRRRRLRRLAHSLGCPVVEPVTPRPHLRSLLQLAPWLHLQPAFQADSAPPIGELYTRHLPAERLARYADEARLSVLTRGPRWSHAESAAQLASFLRPHDTLIQLDGIACGALVLLHAPPRFP